MHKSHTVKRGKVRAEPCYLISSTQPLDHPVSGALAGSRERVIRWSERESQNTRGHQNDNLELFMPVKPMCTGRRRVASHADRIKD